MDFRNSLNPLSCCHPGSLPCHPISRSETLAQALHLAEVVGGNGKGEEALPGLNYTRQQAFYINIAQVVL